MKTFALMSALVDRYSERMTNHAKTSVLNLVNIRAGPRALTVLNHTTESGEEVKCSLLAKILLMEC